MAHEVETMFSVREIPWHKLGKVLKDNPSVKEAIKFAGLDWNVEKIPLFTEEGEEIDTHVATRRIKDSRILGVVGCNYEVLQNNEAFEFFQPFIDAREAVLETAGSLMMGKRVWILAQILRDPMVITGDDIVRKYILLSNSHDGSQAVRVGFTPIRVVCNNTLSMAISNAESRLLRVKHSAQVKANLEEIREIMNLANQQFEATAEKYRYLASRDISSEDLEKYVNVIFQVPEDKNKEATRSPRQDKIIFLFENGRGNKEISKSWWTAYNAVTEYLQHEKGNEAERRLNNMWFGESKRINDRALDTALAMAGK